MTNKPTAYPGADLGLPESGRGSLVTLGGRFAAYLVDWFICLIIGLAILIAQYGPDLIAVFEAGYYPPTFWIFLIQAILGVFLLGGTLGQIILGMRIVTLSGQRARFWQLGLRTLLMLLVIPALIIDAQGRGMHDRIAGTLLIRVR